MPRPEHPADCWHVRACRSDKTCFVRFDLNDYSVPPEYCQRPVTLTASNSEVRILDGQTEIARHERSYDKGAQVETKDHVESILAQKKAALPSRRRETLVVLIPRAAELIEMLINRGEAIHGHLKRLYGMGRLAIYASARTALPVKT